MELTMRLTDSTANMMISTLNDPEEPFTPLLEQTATSVTGCLTNVLKSAAGSSQDETDSLVTPPSPEFVKKASEKLSNMSDAFFGRLVPSEDLVLKTPNLAISLKKVTANDAKGLSMGDGPSKFKLPSSLGNIGGGDINAKMQAIDFNPYTWDNSSKKIKSRITSLELKSNSAANINVSNLDNDIEIIIPISSPPQNSTNGTQHNFLKPNQMSARSYYAELANVPVSLKLGEVKAGIQIKLFIKFGKRPTIDDFDFNFTLIFTSTCDNQTDVNSTCQRSVRDKSVTVIPSKSGFLYAGVLFESPKNESQHSRQRRSCFGHRRERRSCVGVKDPPPKGFLNTVVPKYDPNTDLNYSLTITQSSCLYWSENTEKWTAEGCRVSEDSNTTHLKCLCNHLTSFGGNFIQAPNPIDFDKVFTEFSNLAESGNISVLVTIACFFLLYFIVLVFARKADKRDEFKIFPPKLIPLVKEGDYYYDMVISTGVWKHSATTANISISIKGENYDQSQIPLREKGETSELFGRGSINGFVLVMKESMGPLKEITLDHDNSGDNPSWFVETVVIQDRQTEERWVFPINRWLALEKDDGQIEVTVDSRSYSTFSAQVRSRFARKIADSHLWMSVFGKACSSTFTRVQRASCCLAVLFSAMIANAMFYNIGGESDGAIQVGPFKFSWKQIVIGAQSGIIIAPINIIIAFLFKSSRPRKKRSEKYQVIDEAQRLLDEITDTGCMLPHFFVYIGWFVCFCTTMTAATFTLFYSLMWGKETSEQWLASILISNGQDIFVVQPTKVMMVVIVISFLLTTKNKGKCEEEEETVIDSQEVEIDFLSDDPKQRFKKYQREKMRERSKKEAQLTSMTKDIILHLIFVFLLAIVSYGNKNGNRFLMTTEMRNRITKFNLVNDAHELEAWLKKELISNIYNQAWYNGDEENNYLFTENKMSILVGMPWLRQHRIKIGSCGSLYEIISNCNYDYSPDNEDTTLLSLPGWIPLPLNTSWPSALQICPKPWRYQSAADLRNNPIQGTYNSYEGGGYAAVMGYDERTALGVLHEKITNGWIDRQTRAVIKEFAIFNVNTNLISIASYFYEAIATGAAYTSRRIETFELYSTQSGTLMFFVIRQFLFMAMVLFYFIVMLVHLYRQRLEFYKSVWNMVDFFMIIFSVASVAFYRIRATSVLNTIKAIQANPYEIVHFHTALDWLSVENASIAVAVFMVTVKFLNLIRFNPHVVYLFSSFRQSIGYQLSYGFFFLIVFNAFIVTGMQLFGGIVLEYSSYLDALISQFELLLGKAVPLQALRSDKPFIGPTFAFLFCLSTTVYLMNMLVSVLNESYGDAKTNAEENVQELEMAHFIEQRIKEVFHDGSNRTELKLFGDEATFANMCLSEAEPFCLNSKSIIQCTKERMQKVEKKLLALFRRAENMEADHFKEENDFMEMLYSMANPSSCYFNRLYRDDF
ncbi:polycystic kidney disease protein 1-like 2 [Stylophora pistillata]|uniref:polycystic kidney disease protein 1-like 2 n=1 Tax=Stylophora pistillata TaxID=50429 RepID=UPI000C0464E3|nr:polycystic kidney disease protein 1-like 2 [Stylophora pistillata]